MVGWTGGGVAAGGAPASNNSLVAYTPSRGVLSIRGNYYDAVTDTTSPVYGSADKATRRAAWTVGDRKTPTYEAGIANLTKEESTMMVHYGKDRSQQYTLIRIEEPEKQESK